MFALLWAAVEMLGPATGAGAEQVVWTRYGVHLLVMLFLFRRRGRTLVRSRQLRMQVGRSLLMFGMPAGYVLGQYAIGTEGTLSVFWTAPLLVLALRHVKAPAAWAAGFVAFAGVLLVLQPDPGRFGPGALFAVAMCLCFAGYVYLTERLQADGTVTSLFHSALWVFVVLSVRIPFVWEWPAVQGWIALVLIGVAGLAGLFFLDLGVRLGGPEAVAPTLFLQPVLFAVLVSGGSDLGMRGVLGSLLILAATLASLLGRRPGTPAGHRRQEPLPPSPALLANAERV
jgi:drug/metabolite transporter (DMT)-like permease